MLPINLTAVFVAAVACFVIGFLMHGPIAGKLWMKLANIKPTGKEKMSDMYGMMFKNFLANLLTAYCLANIIFVSALYHNNVGSALGGMGVAFWVWLGFVVTATSMDVIWMGKSPKLWLFEIGSSLLCFLAMGAIIASM
jgi:hypothetical protein